jgi:hypothetical protein
MLLINLLHFQTSSSGGDATGVVCCGGIILVIVAVVVIAISASKQQGPNPLYSARDNYYLSLSKLKKTPTDPDLRQTTLALGRTYSNLTRNNKGVTIFDEVALSNDINAACAGAVNIAPNKQTAPPKTIESRLLKLAELKSHGLISEREYEARRQKILDEV